MEDTVAAEEAAMTDTNFFLYKETSAQQQKKTYMNKGYSTAQAECRLVLTSGARTGAEWIA